MPSEKPRIPFTRPHLGIEEERAVIEVIRSGMIGGGGPVGRKLAQRVKEMLAVRHALPVTSCTHALEIAMLALDVGPGDEVICPSFAFVSAANAIVLRGARVVFADIEDETLALDPADVEARITPRTRGIIVVHYAGLPARIDSLMDIARRRGLFVVEDAAQALGSRWDGAFLGTIGAVGCYSLHETKNAICGEGGIFVTDDSGLFERAEIIREKGTDRSRFLRGEADKYVWRAPGSSFIPADLLCAVAIEQLAKLDRMSEKRGELYGRYMRELAPLQERGELRLPTIPTGAAPNWHIFHFRLTDPARRDALLAALDERGITATFHFVPLHTAPYGKAAVGGNLRLPVTEQVAASLVRLPLFPDLKDEEQQRVIDALFDLLG